MNQKTIIVLDTETTGLDPDKHEIVEICAWAIDPRSLEPIPASAGGEFYSRMRPLRPEDAEAEALAVNGYTLEQMATWPEPKAVFRQFVRWVRQYNRGRNEYTAPLVAGKNVAFDLGFLEKAKTTLHKKPAPALFARRPVIELEHFLFSWFEDDVDFTAYSMDYCRRYFGLSTENAHQARTDVEQTALLLGRFLQMHRDLRRKKDKNTGKLLVDFRPGWAGAGKDSGN